MDIDWIEMIGYAASILVALQFVFYNQIVLRIFGVTGAILFLTYGLLIDAMPLVYTNIFIVLVNIKYFIYRLRKG